MAVPEDDVDIDEEIYCICKQPYDSSRAMVQCKDCLEWLHYSCIGIEFDPKGAIYSDDFDCPICIHISERQNASAKIRNFVRQVSDHDELHKILERIPLEVVKDFVSKQMHQMDDQNVDCLLSNKQLNINNELPDDTLQLIMEFDYNQKSTSVVCRRWNKISDTVKAIKSRQGMQVLQEKLHYDKEEECLTSRINILDRRRQKLLNGVVTQFGFDKKQLENQLQIDKNQINVFYNKQIKKVRELFRWRCSECGVRKNCESYTKCTTCSRELCFKCMEKCEDEDCETEEYYCSEACVADDFGDGCGSCGITLCGVCYNNLVACQWCDKLLCGNCIRIFEECDWKPPYDRETFQICEDCEESKKYDEY